ncbi:MAG: response regulator [Desulfobacteraceae bacterium]|jgi:CheY-like chemotaxis protein|nr:response regulator [Desulfobacteraceae bacterium]
MLTIADKRVDRLPMKQDKKRPAYDGKILLIDDQRSHLRTLQSMFERYGCQAVTVDSAEEAELILEWTSGFDALITDLKMPWVNGVDFCKKTKKKYPDLQIYALSGFLEAYGRHALDEAGFDGVYQKPVCFEMIEDMLNAIEKGASEKDDAS